MDTRRSEKSPYFQNMMDEIEDPDSDIEEENESAREFKSISKTTGKTIAKPMSSMRSDGFSMRSDGRDSVKSTSIHYDSSDDSGNDRGRTRKAEPKTKKGATVTPRMMDKNGFATKIASASLPDPKKQELSNEELSALRNFTLRPVRRDDRFIQCYISRHRKGTNMLKPVYRLFLEEGDQFLLSAQVCFLSHHNEKFLEFILNICRNDQGKSVPITYWPWIELRRNVEVLSSLRNSAPILYVTKTIQLKFLSKITILFL